MASVFTWHTRQPGGGSILADYEIQSVQSVATGSSDSELRTVVLFAVHRNLVNLNLAIKITPIYLDSRRDDFILEQQIHYLLSQLDTTKTRDAAKKTGVVAKKFFTAKAVQPLEHEPVVAAAMLYTDEFNVVPLYDFVIQDFTLDSIPETTGRNKLSGITWLGSHQAAFLVQRRLDGVLPELLQPPSRLASDVHDKSSNDLETIVTHMMYGILQVCCTLHMLLALAFTHGDTHPNNIGYIDSGQVPRHYKLSPNKTINIPAKSHHIMLIDFDRSRAEMIDATGKQFTMVPTKESLNARYNNVVRLTPAQTFFPAVDVFRLVHSMLIILAGRMIDSKLKWTEGFTAGRKWVQFRNLCKAGISKLPKAITDTDAYKKVAAFVAEFGDASEDKLKATAKALMDDGANQRTLWYKLYAESPGTKKGATDFLMPWDVLGKFETGDVPAAGSVDMTMAPLYNKGKVYRTSEVRDESDAALRTDPLRTVFPDEFK